jgi:hypothetical protein
MVPEDEAGTYAPDVPDSYANVAAFTTAAGAENVTWKVLGLIWFDAVGRHDWRLISAPAIAAFRQGAEAYRRLQS